MPTECVSDCELRAERPEASLLRPRLISLSSRSTPGTASCAPVESRKGAVATGVGSSY